MLLKCSVQTNITDLIQFSESVFCFCFLACQNQSEKFVKRIAENSWKISELNLNISRCVLKQDAQKDLCLKSSESLNRQKMECTDKLSIISASLDETKQGRQICLNDLNNVFIKSKNCSQTLRDYSETNDQLAFEKQKLVKELFDKNQAIEKQRNEFDDTTIFHQTLIETLQSDFNSLAMHMQCKNSDDSRCGLLAQKYTCLYAFLFSDVCTMRFVPGQELFNLTVCNTLGDKTFPYLNPILFIENNPITFTLMVILLAFSLIGFVTFVVLTFTLCCKRCCKNRNESGTHNDLDLAPSMKSTASIGPPLHPSALRSMRQDVATLPIVLSIPNANFEASDDVTA